MVSDFAHQAIGLLGSAGAQQPTPALAFTEQLSKGLFAFLKSQLDLGKLAREFAAGAITECPFEDKLIANGHGDSVLCLGVTTMPVTSWRTACRSAILPCHHRGAAPHGW